MDDTTCDKTEATTEEAKDLDCSVCLSPCVQPVELPCHHIFCYLCVKGIIQQSRRCAMCRQDIPSNFLEHPNLVGVQNNSVTFQGSFQWFYQGQSGGWWQYDDRTSMEIEAASLRGEEQCELLIAGCLYVIDLANLRQYRKDNPHKRRHIKKDVVNISKKGVAGIRQKFVPYDPTPVLAVPSVSVQFDKGASSDETQNLKGRSKKRTRNSQSNDEVTENPKRKCDGENTENPRLVAETFGTNVEATQQNINFQNELLSKIIDIQKMLVEQLMRRAL